MTASLATAAAGSGSEVGSLSLGVLVSSGVSGSSSLELGALVAVSSEAAGTFVFEELADEVSSEVPAVFSGVLGILGAVLEVDSEVLGVLSVVFGVDSEVDSVVATFATSPVGVSPVPSVDGSTSPRTRRSMSLARDARDSISPVPPWLGKSLIFRPCSFPQRNASRS